MEPFWHTASKSLVGQEGGSETLSVINLFELAATQEHAQLIKLWVKRFVNACDARGTSH